MDAAGEKLNNSATVYHRIIKFFKDIRATQSAAMSDITSSATSGRHFSKCENTAENAASDGLVCIKSNVRKLLE